LVKCLKGRNLEISHVLLTHWHGDHTGGVADLIAHNPELASRIYKNQPDRGQLPIEDGQTFHAEGATIRAVFTPGHAVDHICFVLKEEQALFTGDNVLGHGFTVIEDLGAYMNSLRYMGDQQCSVGYPGHGAKIDSLSSTIKRYIQREELRVAQVYSILAERGLSRRVHHERRPSFTSRELVTFLYGEVSDSLFDMALEPCMNLCLWKLAEDGKVGFELVGSNRLWYARGKVHTGLVK
jgi:hydrolase